MEQAPKHLQLKKDNMARFLNLKGLSPSDFVDPEKFDKAKQISNEYSFMARPDILPQDEPRFQEIIAGYLQEADKLAAEYQKDKTRDLEKDISILRSKVQQDLIDGEIPAMKVRKMEHDSLDANLRKSKSPQEYAEARSKIDMSPIKYDAQNKTYNHIYLPEYFSTKDEKTLTDNTYKIANKIKADQIVTSFLQDDNFKATYNYDVYTAEKIKQVSEEKVMSSLAPYIEQSSEYERYARENPEDQLYSPDGTINTESKFGKLLKSAAQTFMFNNSDAIVKTMRDPSFEKAMVFTRASAKPESQPFIPVKVDKLMNKLGPKRGVINEETHPNWPKGELENRTGQKVYDNDQINEIITEVVSWDDVKDVGIVSPRVIKRKKLPHEYYLSIELKNGYDVLIDLMKDPEDIAEKLIRIGILTTNPQGVDRVDVNIED